jgi:hypothetical protein
MWLIVDRHREIVLGSYPTRAKAYDAKRQFDYWHDQKFVVDHV